MKRRLRAFIICLSWVTALVVVLLLSAYGALHFPKVQTFAVKKISLWLEKKLNTTVSIERVDFSFFDQLVLEKIFIRDQHKDTLLYAEALKVNIIGFSGDKNELKLNGITLQNAFFNLVQYKGEKSLNFQFIIDAFDTGGKKEKSGRPFILNLKKLSLQNVRFRYDYEADTSNFYGVNFDHIKLNQLNGEFKKIEIKGDTIKARIDELSFRERSGFKVEHLSADFGINPVMMSYQNLNLITKDSKIYTDLTFITESYDDYNDFEEKVIMRGDFRKSHLEFRDLSYFTGELKDIQYPIEFTGLVKGTVSNLKGTNMDIRFASSTRLKGNIKMNGLPDFETTFIQLQIKQLVTSKKDIETIPLPPFKDGEKIKLPSNFEKLGKVYFYGDFTGFPSDFTAYGDFVTELGEVSSDIELKPERNGISSYKGKLRSKDFNIGHFYGIEPILDKVSLEAEIEGKGLSNETVKANVNGKINSLGCYHYNYHNIDIKGHFEKGVFNGKFDVLDPNIELSYNGDIDVRGNLPQFNFNTQIRNANLKRLGILPEAADMKLTANADFNFTGDDIDNIIGSISVKDIAYKDSAYYLHFKKANLHASLSEKDAFKTLILDSDPIDAKITGNFSLMQLENSFKSLIQHYIPALNRQEKIKVVEQNFSFNFKVHDAANLSKLLTKNFEIQDQTTISGNINTFTHQYEINADVPTIKLYGLRVDGISLSSKNNGDKIALDFRANSFVLADSNRIEPVLLKATAINDTIKFNLKTFTVGSLHSEAMFDGMVRFDSDKKLELKFDTLSYLNVEDSLWKFSKENSLVYDHSSAIFNQFSISHFTQKISLQNRWDVSRGNLLQVRLDNFYLGTLNPLLKQEDIILSGVVDGVTEFSKSNGNLVFTANAGFKNLAFNDERLGDGSVIALWDTKKQTVAVNGNLMRGQLPVVSFTGFYSPSSENSLDFEIQLKKLQVKVFESYVKGIFSDLNGFASGDLFLQGSIKKPVIQGEIEIQRGMAKVDYLNTNYIYNGKLLFQPNNILLKDIVLYDENGKTAKLNGEFPHEYFKKMRLNLELEADKFLFLNTSEVNNSLYYGKAVGTGLVKFTGNFDKIVIDVAAKTEKGTVFNIPLSNPEEVGESGSIRFVKKGNGQLNINEKYKVDLTGIEMHFDLEATPDAEVNMIFDSKVGDIISGTGSGILKLEINTLGDFSMFGNYTIKKGSYLFTLKNVINKKFKISEGGTINWSGDPFGADINLEAVYGLKTSLYDIVQSDSSKKRVPVNCVLKMSDKLMSPTIKFDIRLPQSDEKIQNDVRAAINMDNEAELNKQVFSLLMLGRFFPPNDRPSTSSGLSQNTSELISSQISNWLSQSNEYVDLSVKYQASDQVSSQEWQVAARTQLFNERLSIDGNVGMANANTSASNIVGDVNIEYRVTADGKLRLKAYTQSNDYSNLTRIAPYTQGVGVFYREDFDTLEELARMYGDKIRLFKKPKNNTPTEVQDKGGTK